LWGGPGLRRGRRNAKSLRLGDALDFWRVTEIQQGSHLVLTAEMRLPGTATLSFEVEPSVLPASGSVLTMTARFRPRGLAGILYWYSVLPLHSIVFKGMLRGLLRVAEAEGETGTQS